MISRNTDFGQRTAECGQCGNTACMTDSTMNVHMFGARPLKRAIQERIENPLSRLILDGTLGGKDRVKVEAT